MVDLYTERLVLHPVDGPEARRIVDGTPTPGDDWAPDYPFDGDRRALAGFLRATDAGLDPRPWGYYQLRVGGLAVGGAGFHGPPEPDGPAEIGYGLAASARGRGYAAEAVVALAGLAVEHGLSRLIASTTPDNPASRRTLERAGFVLVDEDADLLHYALDLTIRP